MKAFRLLLIAGALLVLPLLEGEARQAYCDEALTRCTNSCKSYPEFFRSGCMIGCGIGYLACGD